MKVGTLLKSFRSSSGKLHLSEGELFILPPVTANGIISTEDDILIDTKYNGSVHSNGHVTIGPDADVEGKVAGRMIHVQGKLTGQIHARDTIIVQGGSRLKEVKLVAEKIDIQTGSELSNVNLTTK